MASTFLWMVAEQKAFRLCENHFRIDYFVFMRCDLSKLLAFFCWMVFLQACTRFQEPVKDPVLPSSMFVEDSARFCDANSMDKFTLGYYGTKPLDTTLHFFIVCHMNDTIYSDQWPAKWMLDMNAELSDSQQIKSLHQQMHAFVEGKMRFPLDSTDAPIPNNQPEFNFEISGHLKKRLFYSKALHKTLEI